MNILEEKPPLKSVNIFMNIMGLHLALFQMAVGAVAGEGLNGTETSRCAFVPLMPKELVPAAAFAVAAAGESWRGTLAASMHCLPQSDRAADT